MLIRKLVWIFANWSYLLVGPEISHSKCFDFNSNLCLQKQPCTGEQQTQKLPGALFSPISEKKSDILFLCSMSCFCVRYFVCVLLYQSATDLREFFLPSGVCNHTLLAQIKHHHYPSSTTMLYHPAFKVSLGAGSFTFFFLLLLFFPF